MKLFYVAAVLLATLIQIQGEDPEEAWEKFQAHFPMNIKTPQEAERRKSNFFKAHRVIEEHNAGDYLYELEHNKFSVMDDEEKKMYTGAIPPEVPPNARYFAPSSTATERQATPVDFRTHNCMQPVKNQGACGSCWAFAGTAVTEFGYCIKTGNKVALSEQEIVDCTRPFFGCNGGWYYMAWDYLAKNGGHSTAASYPYTAVKGTCKGNTTTKAALIPRSNPYTYVTPRDHKTMVNLLTEKKLISVALYIPDSFYYYKSGVYAPIKCDESDGYHAVTVVGFGTLSGVDYWVLRNSWGSSWGANGYVLVKRGVNQCKIEEMAFTTTVIG